MCARQIGKAVVFGEHSGFTVRKMRMAGQLGQCHGETWEEEFAPLGGGAELAWLGEGGARLEPMPSVLGKVARWAAAGSEGKYRDPG